MSDQANACPKCGFPIKQNDEQKIQTVQLTSKKWKSTKLISVLVIIVGLIILVSGKNLIGVGIFLMFLGFIGLFVGKIGAWWTNR